MMVASPVVLVQLVALLGLGGGLAFPLSVPPLPEEPVLSQIARSDCLFYLSWAGTATPDPESGNHVERMLGEPEMQRFAGELERIVRQTVTQVPSPDPTMTADAFKVLQVVLTHPTAMYLSELTPSENGPPVIRGAIVVKMGELADGFRQMLEKYSQRFPVEKVDLNGDMTYQFKLGPTLVTVGVVADYAAVVFGENEIEPLIDRAQEPAPDWLMNLRDEMPVTALSTISYINVEKIVEIVSPMAGPQLSKVLAATGLDGVKYVASVSGLEGEGIVNKTLIGTKGELAGLLSPANAEPLSADDLAPIPADATFALAFRLDARKFFQTVLDVFEKAEPHEAGQLRRRLGVMKERTGLDLENDLLAPLGDTWRLFDSPSGGGRLTGLTAVISLRDAAAAKATNQKLLDLVKQARHPNREPHKTPDVEHLEFAGHDMYCLETRQPDFVVAPTWAITDKELVIGLYPQAVKAYLTRPGDAPSLATLPAVAAALEDKPIKISYLDQRQVFDLVYPILPVVMQSIANELQRNGIDISPTMLPSAQAIAPHVQPATTTVSRIEAGLLVTSRDSLPALSLGTTGPGAVALLLPAVQAAREAARRANSLNNLKHIGLSMHNYLNTYKHFPAAYSADSEGKPLLSWRVHILPYLEETQLYEQFKLDEPWDSEHNKKLIAKMPSVYRSPNSQLGPGMTNYLTIRGENTVFPGAKGIKMREITDGTSNTIMAVEVPDRTAVIWTKPDDYEFKADDPLAGLTGMRPGGFLAVHCDGSARLLPESLGKEIIVRLFERNDGKPIPYDQW